MARQICILKEATEGTTTIVAAGTATYTLGAYNYEWEIPFPQNKVTTSGSHVNRGKMGAELGEDELKFTIPFDVTHGLPWKIFMGAATNADPSAVTFSTPAALPSYSIYFGVNPEAAGNGAWIAKGCKCNSIEIWGEIGKHVKCELGFVGWDTVTPAAVLTTAPTGPASADETIKGWSHATSANGARTYDGDAQTGLKYFHLLGVTQMAPRTNGSDGKVTGIDVGKTLVQCDWAGSFNGGADELLKQASAGAFSFKLAISASIYHTINLASMKLAGKKIDAGGEKETKYHLAGWATGAAAMAVTVADGCTTYGNL